MDILCAMKASLNLDDRSFVLMIKESAAIKA